MEAPAAHSPSGSVGVSARAPAWTLLIPVAYVVHIVEEYLGGFPERFAAQLGVSGPSGAAFLLANGLFWLLAFAAANLAIRKPGWAWALPGMGTIITINAVLHLIGALITRSYSPGMISGLLLWLPLGIAALSWGRRNLPRSQVTRAIILGVTAHLVVPIVGVAIFSVLLLCQSA